MGGGVLCRYPFAAVRLGLHWVYSLVFIREVDFLAMNLELE
jgi:hypothetical protein